MTQLTDEEHNARAMLMDLWYADRIHCYQTTSHSRFEGREKIRLDADTLEPVSNIEAYRRYSKWRQAQDDAADETRHLIR